MTDTTLLDNLLEDINNKQSPQIPLSSDNVMISKAVPIGDGSIMSLRLRGVQDRGYRPQPLEVTYEPLNIARMYRGEYTPKISVLSQSSLLRLLPRVNSFLGLKLSEDDIYDVSFKDTDNVQVISVLLKIKETSVFYSGELEILVSRHWLLLEEVVTNELPFFQHPDPVITGRKSIGLLTWGLDFTKIREVLKIDNAAADHRGAFVDFKQVRNALKLDYGITEWQDTRDSNEATTSLRLYDTSDVPRANHNFQKVIVQTNFNSGIYLGTAYLHFNE